MRNEKNSDDDYEILPGVTKYEALFIFNVGLAFVLIAGIIGLFGIDVPIYLPILAWIIVIYIRGLRKK